MTLFPALTRVVLLLATLLLAPAVGAQGDDYQEASKLFRAGQHAQALERVERVLKSNPKEARARFLKGLILTEQNKPADAITIFTALTEDFPELPEPYNNLAVLYASQGQYERARTALELAIRTHPSYATAHENLGDIYARMASQAYEKALQIDKGNAAAETKLGLVREVFSKTPRGSKPPASKSDSTLRVKPLAAAKTAVPSLHPVSQGAARSAAIADPSSEVIRTVNGWARAWSENDADRYLGFYAPSFETPAGLPRSDWEASRKLRITKQKKIEIVVEAPKVTFSDNDRVSVTFRQNYRSPRLKVASTKTLVMVKAGDRWLIQQERVGS